MKLETRAWGEIQVKPESIYQFAKGIPGFEEEQQFALIEMEESSPFSYLQSLAQENVAFMVVDPFVFIPDYEFELSEEDKTELNITEQVWVRCIVTIQRDVRHSTINLLAPIVLNPVTRTGKQLILHQSGYMARHMIWPHSVQTEEGGE